MRTIIYGKTDTKRVLLPKMKRIIAILVAAALLLTSCGIIFRNEIREIFKDFFVSLTYESDVESNMTIETIYILSYLPEGYTLEKTDISNTVVKYRWENSNGDKLHFEQRPLTQSNLFVDSESGYSKMSEIDDYDVYYRFTDKNHLYVLSYDTYAIRIKTNAELSNEDIVLILDGITIK